MIKANTCDKQTVVIISLLFLSASSSKEDMLRGLDLGAVDFIQKPFSIFELQKKIESLLNTNAFQKKEYLDVVLKALTAGVFNIDTREILPENKFEENCRLYQLTPREKELIHYIKQGLEYKEIARHLFISEKTVVKHVQNIFEKVKVNNKLQLLNKIVA